MRRLRPNRPPGRLRRILRLGRRILLAGVLLLTLLLLWVNQIGLPEPLAALVRRELRQRGWTADCARVRVRFFRGLVAEQLSLSRAGPGGFRLEVNEVVVQPDWRRLWHADFEVAALEVLSGKLAIPLATNASPEETLELSGLAGRLRFLPEDRWVLSEGQARVFGCEARLEGDVSHVASLRRFRREPRPGAPPWRTQLRQLRALIRRCSFAAPPQIRLRFHGDAAVPDDWRAEIALRAPAATTPWGAAEELDLELQLNDRPPVDHHYHGHLRLHARRIRGGPATLEGGRITADVTRPVTNPLPARVRWQVSADRLRIGRTEFTNVTAGASTDRLDDRFHRWRARFSLFANGWQRPELRGGNAELSGTVVLNLARLDQTQGSVELQATGLDAGTKGRLSRFAAAADFHPASADSGRAATPPASWGFWTHAAPWAGRVTASLRELDTPRLKLDHLDLESDWAPPVLKIPRLFAHLHGGVLDLRDLRLNVDTRQASLRLHSTCDVHRLDGVLPPGASRWLRQFSWETPPTVQAWARGVLPPWDGAPADARAELLPALTVNAHVEGQRAGYRGVSFEAARLNLSLSNAVLRLRDFHLRRPEGEADLAYTLELLPRNFHWRLDCRLNPKAAAPAIGRDVVNILNFFDFTNAAHVRGDVWGCFRPPKRTELRLDIDARDFAFRGQRFGLLSGSLQLTNRLLIAKNAEVRDGKEWARVERLEYALDRRELALTNAHTHMDPLRVARAIGPAVERVLAPYQFAQPPEIRLSGFLPTDGRTKLARMRFDVAGGPFHFWRFNFDHVAGGVRWRGDTVLITNFTSGFYHGRLAGHLTARLTAPRGPNLAFDATVTNARLHPIVRDLFGVTNQLAGRLSGQVVVTNGIPDSLDTWYGHGELNLRDGLIWDLPVFGVVSKALNRLSPGLGNNQATDAYGHFTLARGVLASSDLKIETGVARLAYQGTCSLTGAIDAQVRIEPLRSAPVIGPVVSFLFRPVGRLAMLRITGSLGDPKVDFLYAAPFVAPLKNPLGTLKTIFQPRQLPKKSAPPADPPSPERGERNNKPRKTGA